MYYKYLKYVLRHKWYVLKECFQMGLFYRGIMHDMSKFRPSEFIPYAKNFYFEPEGKNSLIPDRLTKYLKSKEIIENNFNIAWLKHQKLNPHHWQYWILQEDSGKVKYLPMPDKYIKEMICDWVGAGKAQGFKSPKEDKYFETRKWLEKNWSNMKFNLGTSLKILSIIGINKESN